VFNLVLRLAPGHGLRILILNLAGARIDRGSAVHSGCYFTRPGRLVVGPDCTVNFGCYLDTRGGIRIGRNVMVGHRTRIYTAGHAIDDPTFAGYQAAVTLEDHAVIFPNVQLMPGVTIGEGAVVLTGSVVAKDVAPYCVVGGNPARQVKQRSREIAYTHRYKVWLPNT
jgi:acetyltransferase-like isoleucine patch superfamily enzyme